MTSVFTPITPETFGTADEQVLRRRHRLPGFVLPSSSARIRPEFTPDLSTLRLLQLLSQFGALPVQLATRIAAVVDGRPTCKTYWSSQSLHRARVIARISRKDLRLPRVAGLGLIMVPDVGWAELPEELGLGTTPPLTTSSRRAAINEQVVLVGEVIRRVLRGDRLLFGNEWLEEAAQRIDPTWGAQHEGTIARALASKVLAFEAGDEPAGLIPADPLERPVLLVGGIWTPHKTVARIAKATSLLAPVTFVGWARNTEAELLLRQRVLGTTSRKARPGAGKQRRHHLVLLPARSRKLEWAAQWKTIADAFHGADPELLRMRLSALVGGGADPAELTAPG